MSAHPRPWPSPRRLWARFGGATAPRRSRRPGAAGDPALRERRVHGPDARPRSTRDPAQLGDLVARPETLARAAGATTPDLVERVPLPRAGARRWRACARTMRRAARSRRRTSPQRRSAEQRRTQRCRSSSTSRRTSATTSSPPAWCARMPGLPDRAVAAGGSEQVGFVLRRLLPRQPTAATPSTSSPSSRTQRARAGSASSTRGDQAARSSRGEELLPLFPLSFSDDNGQPRARCWPASCRSAGARST